MTRTDRILCTECREEFEDTGMVAAHTCSACDALATKREEIMPTVLNGPNGTGLHPWMRYGLN